MVLAPLAVKQEPERRYLPRFELTGRVFYKTPGASAPLECQLNNISCNGISLFLSESLLISQKMDLIIELTHASPVKVTGLVVWKKREGVNYIYGITFDEIDPAVQELIVRYAYEYNRDQINHHWFNGWNKQQT